MSQIRTDNQGRIAKRPEGGAEQRSLVTLLERMGPEIARALPKHVKADRMARIALTALRTTPKLAQCTPDSFLGAIIQASQLGLEVNTPLGHAYLLPFDERKSGKTICQLIIGYQGMLDLTRRSGMVKSIYAFPVYEGDVFDWELGLNPTIKHVPSKDNDRERKRLTHVYAVAKLEGGEPVFTVLTRGEVERYKGRSRASNSGPWVTDFEAMALKTAIRRLYRWLPKSAEMARAEAFDEAPEIGRSQLSAADPEVVSMLQAHGVDAPIEAHAEVEHDPETGEVLPDEMDREPGSEG
jgi:recombination protein RecT